MRFQGYWWDSDNSKDTMHCLWFESIRRQPQKHCFGFQIHSRESNNSREISQISSKGVDRFSNSFARFAQFAEIPSITMIVHWWNWHYLTETVKAFENHYFWSKHIGGILMMIYIYICEVHCPAFREIRRWLWTGDSLAYLRSASLWTRQFEISSFPKENHRIILRKKMALAARLNDAKQRYEKAQEEFES